MTRGCTMKRKKKANVIFIMSDQHRFDCLGVAGNKEIRTPKIDALAHDGFFYKNSFCVAPSCTPSRYSILTGLYPHQHQGLTNKSTIPAGTDTFPRLLQKYGYKTKMIGKLHVTPTYLDVGFDEMVLAEQTPPGRYEDDYHAFLKEINLINEIDLVDQEDVFRQHGSKKYWESFGAVVSNVPEAFDSTTWIGEKAIDAIEEWEGDGHFLKVSFIKPHHPFNPPKPWDSLYDPDMLTLLPGWTETCLERDLAYHTGFFPHENLTKKQLKQIMAYYYANISHIDEQVGNIVDCLKDRGLYDETLIIYTSDHGEYMGFHHMLLKDNHFYDPLAKVPFIIKYPGEQTKSRNVEALISGIDIAPTILETVGCDRGAFMSGVNVSHVNHGRKYVFAEKGRGLEYMVRSQSYKLLLALDEEYCLFFDLNRDPMELNNVYHDPTYEKEIQIHKNALYEEILFKAPAPIHLDEQAEQVNKPKDKNLLKQWSAKKVIKSQFFKHTEK